jgi:GNAT superfamily N-acetyltransferase
MEDLLSEQGRYSIRAFEPQDKEALFELLYALWPHAPPSKLENRWWWQYSPPPILLVVDKEADTLAGLCGFRPFQLYSQGKDHSSAWLSDFYLLPAHQRQGLGTRLIQEIGNRHDIVGALSLSDAAWATFKRLGWKERSNVPLFLSPWLALQRPFSWLASSRSGHGLEVSVHEASSGQFDKSFDELWLRSRDGVAPCAVRDAAALEQRYADDIRRYIILKCVQDGVLEGFMILRILPPNSFKMLSRLRLGLVVDYLVSDNQAVFSQLLTAATSHFLQNGVFFMLCMSNRPAEQRQLRKRGFINPETPFPWRKLRKLVINFSFVVANNKDLPHASWHLTLGDGDVDQWWGVWHLDTGTPNDG